MTAAPVRSLPSGPTAKTVTLRLSGGKAPFSGPLRVVGGEKGSETSKPARFALTDFGETTPDLWLTVLKPAAKPAEGKK